MSKLNDLLPSAAEIRDADQEAENTALRVGSMFVSLIQALTSVLPDSIIDARSPEFSYSSTGLTITFNTITSTGESSVMPISFPAATTKSAGLMSASDKLSLISAVNSLTAALRSAENAQQLAQQTADALNALLNGEMSDRVELFNDILSLLSSIDDPDSIEGVLSGIASDLVKKVDKESGKGLSTNDYTAADKQIVSELKPRLSDVRVLPFTAVVEEGVVLTDQQLSFGVYLRKSSTQQPEFVGNFSSFGYSVDDYNLSAGNSVKVYHANPKNLYKTDADGRLYSVSLSGDIREFVDRQSLTESIASSNRYSSLLASIRTIHDISSDKNSTELYLTGGQIYLSAGLQPALFRQTKGRNTKTSWMDGIQESWVREARPKRKGWCRVNGHGPGDEYELSVLLSDDGKVTFSCNGTSQNMPFLTVHQKDVASTAAKFIYHGGTRIRLYKKTPDVGEGSYYIPRMVRLRYAIGFVDSQCVLQSPLAEFSIVYEPQTGIFAMSK